MSRAEANITELLIAWSDGDLQALDALAPHVQQELRRLAGHYMAGEKQGHVLQPTALVNEAYLRLVDWKAVRWNSRAHFFGVAASMMRRTLVDAARVSGRQKRGGRAVEVALSQAGNRVTPQSAELIALDDALRELERFAPRQARVVELLFFGGLTHAEVGETLGVSEGTARRDWRLAKSWLNRELKRTENDA